MSAIWRNDGSGWRALAPVGFPNEDALHGLVEEAPGMLPLAGEPSLSVVGREVGLGTGSADLVAVEPSGRLVIIEIKLRRNAEARRAVVAQVLTYAAYLHGMDSDTLERDVLASHLRDRGHSSLSDAAAGNDQTGTFDADRFTEGLDDSLQTGRFRLVLVLDDAPEELVRLVGYLETVTDGLLIDLVTVTSYELAGSQVMVPQRIDPEHPDRVPAGPTSRRRESGYTSEGAQDFIDAIDYAPADQREDLTRLSEWAVGLEADGLVALQTYHGQGRMTLLPRLRDEGVGLVTIWNDKGAALQLWRSVFERRAPEYIDDVEEIVGTTLGTGKTTRHVTDELLDLLTRAYRHAVPSINGEVSGAGGDGPQGMSRSE
jgi:hypothetical protein